jgi:hypothetical protein
VTTEPQQTTRDTAPITLPNAEEVVRPFMDFANRVSLLHLDAAYLADALVRSRDFGLPIDPVVAADAERMATLLRDVVDFVQTVTRVSAAIGICPLAAICFCPVMAI